MSKIIEKINNVFNYIGFDGCKHIIVSSIIAFILNILLSSISAILITILIGIVKEVIYDKIMNKGTCSKKDVIMNTIGTIIGGL